MSTSSLKSIEDQVREIILKVLMGCLDSEITPSASLTDDLQADSLDRVEIMMEIEDHFDLSITDEQIESLATVGAISEHVRGVIEKRMEE